MSVHLGVQLLLYVCICMCLCMCVYMYVCTCSCTDMCMHMSMYVCISMQLQITSIVCTLCNIQADLDTEDFAQLTAPLLYEMFKAHTKFPLHLAIQHNREDVVFLFLIEYNLQVRNC